MPGDNVELVRRIYEASARREAETVLALYAPDVEWDFSRSPFASVLDQGVYRGHEGLRRFSRELYESWEQYGDEYEELIEAGDEVVSVVMTRARGRESGVDVGHRHYGLWSIDAGRVTSVRWFGTLDEALEAAGAPR